jgi:hypothetical protein
MNACKDGIIATCKDSSLRYEVCDERNACDQAWQLDRRYRCAVSDYPPNLTASVGGGSNVAGSTSSSAGAGVMPGGGGSGATSSGGGGTDGCDPSGPCSVASTGDQDTIDWYAVDDQNAYYSDCKAVWAVAKTGGFPVTLATGLRGCSHSNVEIDATDLYFTENSFPRTSVVRIPKLGGVVLRLVTKVDTTQYGALASDSLNVYWIDESEIKVLPKLGGSQQTLASISLSPLRLIASGGFLYWNQSDSIARVSTAEPFPGVPGALPVGRSKLVDFNVTDVSVFFTLEIGSVGNLPLGGGAWTEIASSPPFPEAITVDGSWVYWVSKQAGSETRTEILKTNVTGGSPSLVVKAGYDPGRIVTDTSHVYWADGSKLMRAPK